MKHNTEHLNLDKKGKILGLWDIDTSELTGARWDKVQQVIEAYAKVHRLEMELLVRENAEISESQANTFGSANNGGNRLRWGANIPPGLMFKLEQAEPLLFSDKAIFHTFLKKYKGLRVCKTV